jgi:predicted amidohydrolase YtcJ
MSGTILVGGTVLTLDDRESTATAIALEGDRVRAVGTDAEILRLRRDDTEVIELDGLIVCPGFIDAHHHITLAAWCQLGVDLSGCRSAREACARLVAGVQTTHSGPWLYAFNYAPQRFIEGPRLTRLELDRVSIDGPILVMHYSFHEGVVNSAGLSAAGIDRRTRDPFGGRIVRARSGEPTGELLETAVGPVEAMARYAASGTGYEDWLAALQRYSQGLHAAGITHVCDPGVDALLEGYLRRAAREDRLPIPVTMLFVHANGLFQPPVDRLEGPRTGEEMDGLPVGALKIFADGGSRCAACAGLLESLAGVGALAARAAKLRRPGLLLHAASPDRPVLGRDGRLHIGYLHYPPGELAALCSQAHGQGFQLAVHAACNAAIDDVLAAFERLPAGRYPNRVEHLVSLDANQALRLASTGAIGVVQPAYVPLLGDELNAMPTPRRLCNVPLRMLLDASVPLAGSSDAPIAPYAPLAGMQAAVTRRTAEGLPLQPEQAITPLEALHLWTTGAAAAANRGGDLGVLRPGARADLVVLAASPLTVDPDQIGSIQIERTIVGGKTVYRSGAVPAWET